MLSGATSLIQRRDPTDRTVDLVPSDRGAAAEAAASSHTVAILRYSTDGSAISDFTVSDHAEGFSSKMIGWILTLGHAVPDLDLITTDF